jgi:hypothetical protein
MIHVRPLPATILVWTLGSLVLAAPPKSSVEIPPAKIADHKLDVSALADRIDQIVAAKWKDVGVEPSDPADDAEFLRRVYLDLVGRIPNVSEARGFLADKAGDKRTRLIEKLMAGAGYANHFTNVWRDHLIPEARTGNRFGFLEFGFDEWLRTKFADNTHYDQMVRELLSVELYNRNQAKGDLYSRAYQATPISYYLAKELKPENLAAGTARLFMGVKLECAQCHDHPFAKWTRQQFWMTAAFFTGIEGQNVNGDAANPKELADRHEITIPGNKQVVKAAFLDGSQPVWKDKVNSRALLAEWLTRPDNPFFARATVNRMWAHFFGHAIVDPVDDLIAENKPSHPELLEELGQQFVAHDFDFKYLIRAITTSRTYQLSSRSKSADPADPRLFARMALKGLSPEQLFDSLALATGYREEKSDPNRGNDRASPRNEFVVRFAQTEKRTDTQTSILQALSLMNGRFVHNATTPGIGETLTAVIDAPFLDTAGRIETLYLATLSRKPRPDELEKLTKYVGKASSKEEENTALADVFWVLLNSSEFILNH